MQEENRVDLLERLFQRAKRLVSVEDLAKNSPDQRHPVVIREAALIFHAAIRLYGEEAVMEAFSEIKQHHDRYLSGLCLECENPQVPGIPYCAACHAKHGVATGADQSSS